MKNILLERFKKDVLIFDGGIGTEIYRKNVFINRCYEELSLTDPDIIREIHNDYYNAGADVLTTNTFGANRNKLSRFGLADKVIEINKKSVELAKESVDENTLIAGSIGPIGDIPYNSDIDDGSIVDMVREHISAVYNSGADFIIFETLPCLKEVVYALEAIQTFPETPFIVSIAVDRDCRTYKGEPVNKILDVAFSYNNKPSSIGLNCGVGPEGMLSALEKLMPICLVPVVVQPNAGIPRQVDNRTIYMSNPEYFTTYALRFVNLGVRGVGGCCGTTPKHIKDISRSIKPLGKASFSGNIKFSKAKVEYEDPVSLENRSDFGKKLKTGEWIKTIEIVPPKGYELEQTIEKAIVCKNAGIDAINIPDGPRASSRISPLITSIFIKEQAEIEPILHFCCRDRNLIGMQSDLLGCAAAGIKNLLFVTGDPPKLGDYPFASAVFDADSIGMSRVQASLNRGVDLGGNVLSKKTEAVIGVGADPSAIDFEREIRRTIEKIEAGAEYIITQPVFDIDALFRFLDRIKEYKIPVIAGIWPLASYRNAEFMNNEVPGVSVPDHIMKRMALGETKEKQRLEGIEIARESIYKIKHVICGVQVSAPFGNVNTAIEVLK